MDLVRIMVCTYNVYLGSTNYWRINRLFCRRTWTFSDDLCSEIGGKNVLSDGNEAVLGLLDDDIIMKHKYIHSYPYDWRTKQPVIIRASPQWFIDVNQLRSSALEMLEKNVRIISGRVLYL